MPPRRVVSLVVFTQLCSCAPVRIAPYATYTDSALHPSKTGAPPAGALPGEFFCSDLQESANDLSAGHSVAAVMSGTLAAVLTVAGGLVLSHANGEVPTRNVGLGLGVGGLVLTLPTLWFASRAGAASEAARQSATYRTGQLDGLDKPTTPEEARALDEVRFARCATILGSWQDRRSAVSEVNGRVGEILNQSRDSAAFLQQQKAQLAELESQKKRLEALKDSLATATASSEQKLKQLGETVSKVTGADAQKVKAQLDELKTDLSITRALLGPQGAADAGM